jgi:hypothetical protein
MADKLTKQQVSIRLILHLEQYARRVSNVVEDYKAIQGEREMPKAGKDEFALACMQDVAALTDILAQFLTETMDAGEQPAPQATDPSEADVIDFQTYKANGGLLN